ncbi:MAG TPA: OsmC family protein [Acidimicrobiia bacterium]|nr:OsmC family protein [Acidimicrobiia bacterium]
MSRATSAVHHYRVSSSWSGSTGAGYDAYSRAHTTVSPPAGASLEMSADPAFLGDPTLLNPEQLLLAAAASCQLLSFLAVAARARVDVVEYHDDAEAEMPEAVRPVRITRITLRPRISVRGDVAGTRLRHLVEVAHRECYIANSVASEIVIEPTFVRVAPAT